MKIRSLRQIKDLTGKTVFLRADFNVPLSKGKVMEDYKIVAALPTLRFLLRYDCRLVIATHLGDPAGKNIKDLSTAPVAKRLEKLLGKKIKFVDDCIGEKVAEAVGKLKEKEIIFLENLRFHKGEEANEKKFAQELARPADIYVNNAFAVSHRAHASVSEIKKYLPSYAGLLVEEELEKINQVLKPAKPLVVVMGGAKISTKLPVIENFAKQAKHILVGGAIANDFLKNLGYEVGRSLVGKDAKMAKKAQQLYRKFGNKKIILPLDFVVSNKKDGSGKVSIKKVNNIAKSDIILDIGPDTIGLYSGLIKEANTLIWNGPMGLFEVEKFKHGTMAIARLIAARSSGNAFGIVGGGETVEALRLSKMLNYVDWISTGGGAMLEYLAGKEMPGLKGIVK